MKTTFTKSLTLILLLNLLAFYGISAQNQDSDGHPLRTETTAETDLVHLGDLIDVDVIGSLDFDWRGTLTPEGFLNGVEKSQDPIFALCRTEADIASDIAKEYGKVLRDPQIVVKIIDRSGRPAAILDGAVKSPHRFRIKRSVSLSELIVMAGGITDTASGEIRVYRPGNINCVSGSGTAAPDSDSQSHTIQISDLLRGKTDANPQIQSGDIVSVLEAFPIYVIGGVNNPKQLSSRARTTLSAAISSAGGLARDAVETDITIFRRAAGDVRTIRPDLKKIEDKLTPDIELKPYDIVDVGQRGKASKKFPPVLENGETGARKAENLPLKVID
ncbi:MAG TPA: SLBB domain-containing protein [Pyrinomonadaceae bacterium]|nr:SLBB domain-containing protein [Pyrinomonadaceae bacterium]